MRRELDEEEVSLEEVEGREPSRESAIDRKSYLSSCFYSLLLHSFSPHDLSLTCGHLEDVLERQRGADSADDDGSGHGFFDAEVDRSIKRN